MKIKSVRIREESDSEKKLVQAILKDIEKNTQGKKHVGSISPTANMSHIEKMKYSIVRDLVIFKKMSGFSQTEMGKLIGVNKSRITEILHYRISKFSLDTLIQYLFKLEGRVKETDDRIEEIWDSFTGDLAS